MYVQLRTIPDLVAWVLGGLLLGAALVGPAHGSTYLVTPDGSGDFPTIAAAVAAATHGDVIELGDGTFSEDGNRDVSCLGKAVTIRSASGNAELCIIDCGGSALENHRGFYLHGGEGAGTVIENLTIQGGYQRTGGGISISTGAVPGPRLIGCVIEGNTVSDAGGGLYCVGAVELIDCRILDNNAANGAGVLVSGDLTMTGCTIAGNEISVAQGTGAAVYLTGAGLITSCTIADNSSPSVGDLFHLRVDLTRIENCIIAENPGGMPVYCCCQGSAELWCCNIFGNADGDWVACAAGQEEVNDNQSIDPIFCRDNNPDLPYSLSSASPCLEAAQPECGLLGAWEQGCEDTPVHQASWGRIKTLFERH